MVDGGYFEKKSRKKTCVRDILRAVGMITFKFDVVVLWVFLMIWLPFGKNPQKQDGRRRIFWKK